MGYKKLETGGEFFKFEEEGQALEGKWLGSRPSQFERDNGYIKTAEGKICAFALSAALRDLEFVPVGTQIKVVMTGWLKVKGRPQPMKTFDMFIDDSVDQDTLHAEIAKSRTATKSESNKEGRKFTATDEDIPF